MQQLQQLQQPASPPPPPFLTAPLLSSDLSGKLMRVWQREARRLRSLRVAADAIRSSHASRLAGAAVASWRWRYAVKKKHHSALARAAAAMVYRFRRRAFNSLQDHVVRKKEVRSSLRATCRPLACGSSHTPTDVHSFRVGGRPAPKYPAGVHEMKRSSSILRRGACGVQHPCYRI